MKSKINKILTLLTLVILSYSLNIRDGVGFNSKNFNFSPMVCFKTRKDFDSSNCGGGKNNITGQFAMNKEEMEDLFKIGPKFNIEGKGIGKFKFELDILKEDKSRKNSFSFYFTNTASLYDEYSRDMFGDVEDVISESFLNYFLEKPEYFLSHCGDYIPERIEKIASLVIKATVDFDEHSHKDILDINTELNLKNQKGALDFMFNLKNSTIEKKLKGKFSVQVDQIGGSNPSALATAMKGVDKGLSCSLDDLSHCENIIKELINYGTNNFPDQIDCSKEDAINSFVILESNKVEATPLEDSLFDDKYKDIIQKWREAK